MGSNVPSGEISKWEHISKGLSKFVLAGPMDRPIRHVGGSVLAGGKGKQSVAPLPELSALLKANPCVCVCVYHLHHHRLLLREESPTIGGW